MLVRFVFSFALFILILARLSVAIPIANAQSGNSEKTGRRDFGSSLKRLNWDPEKGTAVETSDQTSAPGSAANEDVVRVETDLVVCDVQVRDKSGRIVEGLTQNDFNLTEDAQPQHIEHFSLGNDQRVGRSIVLLIDYSGSQSPFIKSSVAAAKILVDELSPKDTMAIVTDDVSLLIDFTRDKTQLKQALDSLAKKSAAREFGRSLQFSALMATVREMFTAADLRPIIIFQTDGDELFNLQPSQPQVLSIPVKYNLSSANFSLRDIYLAIEKSRASVYTVIPGTSVIGLPAETDEQRNASAPTSSSGASNSFVQARSWFQLAAAGAAIGGWTSYLQTPKQAPEIYRNILADINSRYVIGYYSTNKAHDGSRRNVTVAVRDHPEYSISGRRSYIAPAQ
ncbi:MAG: hypothetical protein QOK48_1595 [Blastocatellia bacterium]|jgi:VWFA-related protein|nr:hypothetical protein [Blastocatellia bacterium]